MSLEPGFNGSLKVRAGGSAGFTGELPVAKVTAFAAVFTLGQTKYQINGSGHSMDVAPYFKNDRAYLPVRFAARAGGVSDGGIIWNQAGQSVIIKKGAREIKLTIGSQIMYVDNNPVTMDAAPEVIEPGRTMLPLRWVAEALGADVHWVPESQSIVIASF